ncbi:MAG: lactonase family protein [candidate division Zixibacteria bacterium]|nr:lactonase family protein [candidate division Zixibacteria bacterium]
MDYLLYLSVDGHIARYRVQGDSGELVLQEKIYAGTGVMSLVLNRAQNRLYASARGIPEIQTYARDTQTGTLTLLGRVAMKRDACFLYLDATERYLLSAYYSAGEVAVHIIDQEGMVTAPPVQNFSTAHCAHCIKTDASNRYVFVPHVAESNAIFQYVFDETTGRLTPNDPPAVHPPKGTGPRHYEHHPSLPVVYVDNEQDSSVTAYRFDTHTGTLAPFQTVSSLPSGFSGENTCAQLHIHPSGRFIYTTNRGHDSVACFAIDPVEGALHAIGHAPTEKTPRAFNLDPDGRFLFAAGQGNGRLASYRVDTDTGRLAPLTSCEVGNSPCWVLVTRAAD